MLRLSLNNTAIQANKGPWFHVIYLEKEASIYEWHSFCIGYTTKRLKQARAELGQTQQSVTIKLNEI